ncbi:MAG: hypothetical protein H0T09_04275 [Actinobacteria bacterium]|nr:hypothetical protein [Actinomycetota bacterium]
MWAAIALAAEHESPLWADSLRPPAERDTTPVFSALAEERFALGLETIYEGYLLHYGEPRLFSPEDVDTALLLGDYLYAEGLVRVAALEEVLAVSDLAELISLCAQLRAENRQGDGLAWAATAAWLGHGELEPAREALRAESDSGPLAELARTAAGDEAIGAALGAHLARVR